MIKKSDVVELFKGSKNLYKSFKKSKTKKFKIINVLTPKV